MNRRYGLLTLVYCAIIFGASSIERVPEPLRWVTSYDLAAHAIVYAGLGWLAGMTLRAGAKPWRGWQLWAAPIAFAAAYGASDEVHQFFVPGRYCALADWMADVVGAVAVQIAFLLRNRHRVEDG